MALKDTNTRLHVPIRYDRKTGNLKADRALVETIQRQPSRKTKDKALLIFATYCPFCSEKYPEEEKKDD